MYIQRKWLTRYVGIVRGASLWKICRILLGGPEASVFDLANILRGTRFSTEAMWDEVSRLNLPRLAPALRVLVFFFIGRHDHVIDPRTSAAYFEKLAAPAKEFVWFEDSAHEPAAEEPGKFHSLMATRVRPVAVAAETITLLAGRL